MIHEDPRNLLDFLHVIERHAEMVSREFGGLPSKQRKQLAMGTRPPLKKIRDVNRAVFSRQLVESLWEHNLLVVSKNGKPVLFFRHPGKKGFMVFRHSDPGLYKVFHPELSADLEFHPKSLQAEGSASSVIKEKLAQISLPSKPNLLGVLRSMQRFKQQINLRVDVGELRRTAELGGLSFGLMAENLGRLEKDMRANGIKLVFEREQGLLLTFENARGIETETNLENDEFGVYLNHDETHPFPLECEHLLRRLAGDSLLTRESGWVWFPGRALHAPEHEELRANVLSKIKAL